MGSDRDRDGYRWEGDLLVTPGAVRAAAMGVWSCSRCGTAVTATGLHDRWHADIDAELAVAVGERLTDAAWAATPLGAPGG